MSRYTITIGKKIFSSKSKALEFYKTILNSYDATSILSENDFFSFKELLSYRESIQKDYEANKNIKSILIDYHPEFKNTKCFFLISDNKKKEVFSYRYAINGMPSDYQRFTNSCRFLVAERLRNFKKQKFKNRPVKCAITNNIVEWEECQIDHKAPLTFSVIIKSFIVSKNIDVSNVEYLSECTKEKFKNKKLSEEFDIFHKEMAVLRILATKENNKLSGSGRIKPTKKDGILS